MRGPTNVRPKNTGVRPTFLKMSTSPRSVNIRTLARCARSLWLSYVRSSNIRGPLVAVAAGTSMRGTLGNAVRSDSSCRT